MVQDGMIERFGIKEVYGMHNSPGLPVGHFSIRPGPFYASTDNFTLHIRGRGGHAAKPHVTIDTTLVAAQIIVALQSIVSRNSDPLKSVVVSVTSMRTESDAFNVIPAYVELRGTLRTFDPELRVQSEAHLRRLVTHTALAFGAGAQVDWKRGYPAMVNSPDETDFAASVAFKVSGHVDPDAPPLMGGEDFSYMLQVVPGAYIQIGNGDSADVHNPMYNFNDEAIPAGSSYWAELVETRMPAA